MATNKHPHHKHKKTNTVLEKIAIEKRIKEGFDASKKAGMEFAITAYNIISIMALYDKLGLSDKQIEKYVTSVNAMADSINGDYVTIEDMIKAIKEEHGIKINDEVLLKYYPALEGYLSPKS